MRCLLKVSIPVETGNAAISDGSLPKTIDSILADLKPEAAYFAEDNGKRTGFIFFDLKDTSQIPAVAEPWTLLPRELPAAATTTRPLVRLFEIAVSIISCPSCGPKGEPRLRLTTTGLPMDCALLKMKLTPSAISVSKKEVLTNTMSA